MSGAPTGTTEGAKRFGRGAALGVVALLVTLGGLSWIALEGQEVARLHSVRDDGLPRTTRVWVVEAEGAVWIEAATPERPWLADLLAHPRVELERAGVRRCVLAEPQPGPAPRRRLRGWLRARYGWADAWVGLLQDTSQAIAVRLQACPASTPAAQLVPPGAARGLARASAQRPGASRPPARSAYSSSNP